MITINPSSANVKFGTVLKFTSSELGRFNVKSVNGSTITGDGNYYVAGQPVCDEQTAQDVVTVTALNNAQGSASAIISLRRT
jgi:FKBP-type peptidyl-prolyl cis-trans isomerase 2